MTSTRRAFTLLLTSVFLWGCKADKAGGNGNNNNGSEDAGVDEILPPPSLSNLPESTPRDTVAIRGTSTGDRVAIIGGASGVVLSAILPGGNFCADVDLNSSEPTDLTIYSMGDGLLSESIQATVTRDAAAPEPSDPTCSGTIEPECAAAEICDNEVDDDCNGYVDLCDLGCSSCTDDNLEPNDFPFNVPIVGPGEYDLQICPCRDDWFAFDKRVGQRIRITADGFTHEQMNLNVRLYETVDGELGPFAAGSFSATNEESIDYTVETEGLHYLRIYIFGGETDGQGSYRLTIE